MNAGMSGLIVVGSITADVTTFSERLPDRGETILGDDVTLVLGGKGANQAVAGALAGVTTHLVGCVGSDLFRDLVLDGLRSHGVELSHVRTMTGPTGIAHIRVDSRGDNDIVIVPLANSLLTGGHVDDALLALNATAKVLVTQLEVPAAITAHAIQLGNELGLTVVLDPAPAVTVDEALWQFVDVVTPNETEASLITGLAVTDVESATAAGRWFCERGVANAVITLASAGAVLVTVDSATYFEPFVVDAIDSTAAGDAFTGFLGASLAQGLALPEAITRAMAAGALAVTKRGASPSLPAADEVDKLLATQTMPAPQA